MIRIKADIIDIFIFILVIVAGAEFKYKFVFAHRTGYHGLLKLPDAQFFASFCENEFHGYLGSWMC